MRLSHIWRDRFHKIYEGVARTEHDHRALANISDHVTNDYRGRFLIELVQNAIDQARKPCEDGSRQPANVGVVCQGPTVVVLNSGRPLQVADLKSLTAVGLTTKDPAVDIGNKGVGFKAVYEATSEPLLFGGLAPGCLRDRELNWAVRLSRAPWADASLLEAEGDALNEFLHQPRFEELRLRLRHVIGPDGSMGETLRAEVRQALPEQFPLHADVAVLHSVLAGLSPSLLAPMVTAVVLQLHDKALAKGLVESALAELRPSSRPGSLMLPLPGFSGLWLVQRRGEAARTLTRWTRQEEPLGPPGLLRVVTTEEVTTFEACEADEPAEDAPTHAAGDLADPPDRSAVWLQAVGHLGRSDESEAAVIKAIEKAELPRRAWQHVKSATMRVSLSLDSQPEKLGVGRLTIALPTQEDTHTPWWVDGPFHGTLSRKGLDLANPYNVLLLKEAARLAAQATDWLRADDGGRDPIRALFALDASKLAVTTKEGERQETWPALTVAIQGQGVYGGAVVPAVGAFTTLQAVLVPEAADIAAVAILHEQPAASGTERGDGDGLARTMAGLCPWKELVESRPKHAALRGRHPPNRELLHHLGLLTRLRELSGAKNPALPADLYTHQASDTLGSADSKAENPAESLLEA